MGLKRGTPEAADEVKKEAAAPTTPPAKPAARSAAKPAAAEDEVRNTFLRAVTYPIGDPITQIKYQTNVSMPAAVKKGNWVDCQIKAGVLREVPPDDK